MTILHIFKSVPDELTKTLSDIVSENNDVVSFNLYEDQADYEKLIDLIFETKKNICWW